MDHQLQLPIERYSYATNASAATSSALRWNHLAELGMSMTLERFPSGSFSDEIYLKILLTNNTVPEELPLRELSQQAESSLTRGIIQNVADLPLSVVVGRPRLAISYTAHNAQLRRFQIRFKHERDFDTVLNVLRELRCNIRESQSRPNTAEQPRPTTTGALQNSFAMPPVAVEATRPTSAAATCYRPIMPLNYTDTANQSTGYQSGQWSQNDHAALINRLPSYPPPSSQSQQQGSTSYIPPSSQAHSGEFRGATELNSGFFGSKQASIVPRQTATHMNTGNPAQQPTSATFAVNAESASQILPPRRILPFSPSPTKPPPSTAPVPSALSNDVPASKKRPASSTSVAASKKPAKKKNSKTSSSTTLEHEERLPSKIVLAPLNVNKAASGSGPATAKPNSGQPITVEVPSSQQAQAGTSEHDHAKVLRQYADHPSSERQTVIDTMLCQLIEDDNFKTLCSDVENAWRRIGLGY